MQWNRYIGAIGLIGFACCGAMAHARDFVVDAAACGKSGGDEGEVIYCTVQEAINAAFSDGGGDVVVMPGVYRENLIVREDVRLNGEEDGAVIEFAGGTPPAMLQMHNHSAIHDLTLRMPAGDGIAIPIVSIVQVEEVELEGLTIDGGFNRGSIGVFVQNQTLETSRIRKSTITGVEVGVLAEDTLFQITRCFFEDILRDAIYVRPPSIKGDDDGEDEFEAPELGDDDDLEFSGFNRFRNIGGFEDALGNPINEGDAFLLRNTTGTPLLAQLNDWGIYESSGIANLLSTQEPGVKGVAKGDAAAVFEPFLGKSLFPGSVFARLKDAVSAVAITNGNPRLTLRGADTNINPVFDLQSNLYSFTFINPDTYSVQAQAPAHFSASRVAIVGPGEIVAMDISLQPDGTAEGEPTGGHSMDQNGNGQVELTELLRVVQFYNVSAYHCQAGTEDGFAVGAGSTACEPHAGDYNPQDWRIGLSETLRSVQFFNSGGYRACPEGEDGYCPAG